MRPRIGRRGRGAGIASTQRHAVSGAASPQPCLPWEGRPDGSGSCGTLFDEVPVFNVARVPAITSGVWRSDMHPVEVWAGTMGDAELPVLSEAQQLARELGRQLPTPVNDASLAVYNNDPAVSFADVQKFLQMLENRVRENGNHDVSGSTDDVEIEIYAGGTGIARTYAGWFAVSGYAVHDSTLQFDIDTTKEIPPSALDLEILKRASTMITSEAAWNRADNRKCPATATTWSIYCAVERSGS